MRKIALAAGGLALVLALTACGKSTGGNPSAVGVPQNNAGTTALFSDPLQLVAAAKAGTEKSKSSKFSLETGASGISMKSSGQARYDGANTAMSMTIEVVGMQMEMRLLGKTIYMKLPDATRQQAGITKPWVKAATDDPNSPLGKQFGGNFDQLVQQNNPATMLDQIQKAGQITKSEQTKLDGQDVSHYTIDLDVQKMLDQLPAGLPADTKTQLAGKNVHMPMDVWLTTDQLPAQIVMDMGAMVKAIAGNSASAQNLPEMKMTMKYTDWGAPVDIQAPPADQVADASELPGHK